MQNNSKILEQHRREVKLMFIQFLKKNKALNIYKHNLLKQNHPIELAQKVNPFLFFKFKNHCQMNGEVDYYKYFMELINYAFCWEYTQQGHKYWKELDTKWREKVKDFVKNKK